MNSSKNRGFTQRRTLGYGAVFALAGLGGCIDTSQPMRMEGSMRLDGPITIQMQMQGPSVRYDGTFVSEDLFKTIKVDETSEQWLIAALGEPDRRVDLSSGGSLLVWAYRLAAVEGSFVNVVDFGSKEDKAPAHVTTIIRVDGGVVKEKWRG